MADAHLVSGGFSLSPYHLYMLLSLEKVSNKYSFLNHYCSCRTKLPTQLHLSFLTSRAPQKLARK
uniref:Uncharacterized protein n=1 Tax=Arundo donax TaxID=35708 RepID=A0A0A9BV91_ARUDO